MKFLQNAYYPFFSLREGKASGYSGLFSAVMEITQLPHLHLSMEAQGVGFR
jgi:hypothetical protein